MAGQTLSFLPAHGRITDGCPANMKSPKFKAQQWSHASCTAIEAADSIIIRAVTEIWLAAISQSVVWEGFSKMSRRGQPKGIPCSLAYEAALHADWSALQAAKHGLSWLLSNLPLTCAMGGFFVTCKRQEYPEGRSRSVSWPDTLHHAALVGCASSGCDC